MTSKEILPLSFSQLATHPSYHYRWAYGDTMYHHHKDFYELSLITQGNYKHYYKNQVEIVDEGTLLLFDTNEIHRLNYVDKPSFHFTICLSKSYFSLLMQFLSADINLFANKHMLSCKIDASSLEFLRTIANNLANKELEAANVKLFFLNSINLILKNRHVEVSDEYDVIDDIIENLHNYTYLTIPVQEIYGQYDLSTPTILKRFKNRTGTTIARYQMNLRFEYATQMLQETNHSIEYIADILGFCTTSHFYETFKQYYGMTPSQYRKTNHPNFKND